VRKLYHGATETSLDLLSAMRVLVMKFHFGMMLCSNLDNENSDAGHIEFSCRPAGSPPLFCKDFVTCMTYGYVQNDNPVLV